MKKTDIKFEHDEYIIVSHKKLGKQLLLDFEQEIVERVFFRTCITWEERPYSLYRGQIPIKPILYKDLKKIKKSENVMLYLFGLTPKQARKVKRHFSNVLVVFSTTGITRIHFHFHQVEDLVEDGNIFKI